MSDTTKVVSRIKWVNPFPLTGLNDSDLARIEMVTLLCISDRTHSQLVDMMPEKCGLSGQPKDFESTLKEVGTGSL